MIDKPIGPTSRDVVNEVNDRLGFRGAGHCGTLDPAASGLLILALGRATRVQDLIMRREKVYEATFRFGARSSTDDGDGEIIPSDAACPEEETLRTLITGFIGEIRQRPPAHSAIRIGGRRMHEAARAGENPIAPERTVRVTAIDVLSYASPDLCVRVTCGAGTYVRSLARDIGELAGCGAFVKELRRTRSGHFDAVRALAPDVVRREDIMPLEAALEGFPTVDVDDAALVPLLQGKRIPWPMPAGRLEAEFVIRHAGRVIGRGIAIDADHYRLDRLIQTVTADPPTHG